MVSEKDHAQISAKGIDITLIYKQLDDFVRGFPFAVLDRPAVAGDGIFVFSKDDVRELAAFYEKKLPELKVVKFVPASGAATRMFKDLYAFFDAAVSGQNSGSSLLQRDEHLSVKEFFERLFEFAFYNDLKEVFSSKGSSIEQHLAKGDHGRVLEALLDDIGLAYGKLPKGLLKFHRYEEGSRTALEEHLAEAALYANDGNGEAEVHFTVSPEHLEGFKIKVAEAAPAFERKYGVKFKVSYSQQKPSTDTLAVDLDNKPFRNNNGSLLFRPGGHGALIENLNEIDADIIFIKNIDNVVPDYLKDQTVLYKKALAAVLLKLQEKVFAYLEQLSSGNFTKKNKEEISRFVQDTLHAGLPENFSSVPEQEQVDLLSDILNRPIRVCGMVKNEGEPGGGPFWVRSPEGKVTLQIVEGSQIDTKDKAQAQIMNSSTHFNPVDLVCGTRDYKGKPFDLHRFIDHSTGFISVKSKDGKSLKAMELPGLWNGAMAHWITVFVEVPIITFNPVKTVNDLLRKTHQPG